MSKLIIEEIIHIRSTTLLPLMGEEDEIVNDGKFGKAVCEYLEEELKSYGFVVSRFLSEDWGWWLEIENDVKPLEVGIYCNGVVDNVAEYAINLDTRKPEFFQIKSLKKVSRLDAMLGLKVAMQEIFKRSPTTEIISISREFPF